MQRDAAGFAQYDHRELDVRQQIEIFVIFVGTAFAFADLLLGFDELDTLDPFYHFIAELVLHPQPQRRTMKGGERLAIHLERKQALRFERVFQGLRVVIRGGIEDGPKNKMRSSRPMAWVGRARSTFSSEGRPIAQCLSIPGCNDAW